MNAERAKNHAGNPVEGTKSRLIDRPLRSARPPFYHEVRNIFSLGIQRNYSQGIKLLSTSDAPPRPVLHRRDSASSVSLIPPGMTEEGVKPREGQKCGYPAALSQITSLSFDLPCSGKRHLAMINCAKYCAERGSESQSHENVL